MGVFDRSKLQAPPLARRKPIRSPPVLISAAVTAEGVAATVARETAFNHPLVQAILEAFPGAKIETLEAPQSEDPEPPADWAALIPPDDLYEGDEE